MPDTYSSDDSAPPMPRGYTGGSSEFGIVTAQDGHIVPDCDEEGEFTFDRNVRHPRGSTGTS